MQPIFDWCLLCTAKCLITSSFYLKGSELENKTAHENVAAKSLLDAEASSEMLWKQPWEQEAKGFQIAWEFGCLCGSYSKQLQKWLCVPANHLGHKITAKLTLCVQDVKLLAPFPYFLSFLQNGDCQQSSLGEITPQHIGRDNLESCMPPNASPVWNAFMFSNDKCCYLLCASASKNAKSANKPLAVKGYTGLPVLKLSPSFYSSACFLITPQYVLLSPLLHGNLVTQCEN